VPNLINQKSRREVLINNTTSVLQRQTQSLMPIETKLPIFETKPSSNKIPHIKVIDSSSK